MAVTTEDSTQYDLQTAAPATAQPPADSHGRLRRQFFEHTQAVQGDATSKVRLVVMPAGVTRVFGVYMKTSALGVSRTMDLGHNGYTDLDGDAQSADPDHFSADEDVAAAINKFIAAGAASTEGGKKVQSKSIWVLTAQVNDAALPVGATLAGWVEYAVD